MTPTPSTIDMKVNYWHVYRAFVGLGILCGFVIVAVYTVTKPIIKQNKDALLKQAIQKILPTAQRVATFIQQDDGNFRPRDDDLQPGHIIHVGYNAQRQLVGFAIEAKGMGYQDAIHVLYGYVMREQVISGYEILDSRETPGLGTRISSDQDFMSQFAHLDVSLTPDQSGLQNVIDYRRKRRVDTARQVQYLDTISGATVSSRALIRIIANSAARWIPVIVQHQQDFLSEPKSTQPGGASAQ